MNPDKSIKLSVSVIADLQKKNSSHWKMHERSVIKTKPQGYEMDLVGVAEGLNQFGKYFN